MRLDKKVFLKKLSNLGKWFETCTLYPQNHLNLIEHFELGKVTDKMDVLDVGCGGEKTYGYTKGLKYKTYTGLDPLFKGPGIVPGIAEDMPFDNNDFDLIIMISVLQHCQDPDKALQECVRVLKPGGKIYATVYCSTVNDLIAQEFTHESAKRIFSK